MSFEQENVAFDGNNFSSNSGSVNRDESFEISKEHDEEDRKFNKDEKKKDGEARRKEGNKTV